MLGESGVSHSLTPSRGDRNLRREDTASSNENASPSDGERSFLVTDAGRGDRFHHSISEAAKSHKFGFAVQVKERDFYNDPANKLYLGLNDQAGAVVTAEADLVSVFKHPAAKGSIAPMLEEASRDALTLDGFDVGGKLPDLYAVFGFRPAARVAFNKEYAPDGWDYVIAGEPDVVLMVRDTTGASSGGTVGSVSTRACAGTRRCRPAPSTPAPLVATKRKGDKPMDFISSKRADQYLWWKNMSDNIAVEGPKLGLAPADVTAVKALADAQLAAM